MHELTAETFPQDDFLANMYLLYTAESLSSGAAIAVDPSRPALLLPRLHTLGIRELLILLTHEHYDHTVGVNALRDALPVNVLCHAAAAERMLNPRNNRPLSLLFPDSRAARERYRFTPYTCTADETFGDTLRTQRFGMTFSAVSCPGHSPGSCCYTFGDLVFTGDSLLPDTPTVTRFPGGSAADFAQFTLPYLKQLPPEQMICPGHGATFRMKDAAFDGACFRLRKHEDDHTDEI